MNRTAYVAMGLSFASAALVWPSQSHAESARRECDFSERVLPRVTPLPSNAPGIVVLPPAINVVRDAVDMSFSVKSPAGDAQEVKVESELFGSFLLRPTNALNEGRYTVKYLNVCDYWQAANQYKEQIVNVGPAVELPKRLATSATGTFEYQSLCYPIRGQVKVEVELTDEMKAYRELAKFNVVWGDRAVQTSFGDYGVTSTLRPAFFLPAPDCQKGQATVSGLLSISAHVAGAGFDPVSFVTPLTVPCPYAGVTDPLKVPECTVMPAPNLDAAGADIPDALRPASTTNLDASDGSSEPSSGMCSYSNSRSSAPFALFTGIVMILRIGWTRRRGYAHVGPLRANLRPPQPAHVVQCGGQPEPR